ncbi:MAG: FHA domain-containing protein [Myxococcota bacterium]|nr:FHA domain-containing protein [Myxococcota bacterium]
MGTRSRSRKDAPLGGPQPGVDLHAARTLLVPEEAIEQFRLQPAKKERGGRSARGEASGRSSPAEPPPPLLAEPQPVPLPPGAPGPWQIPTDQPRPIHPMQRAPQGGGPAPLELSCPLPPPALPPRALRGATLLLEDHHGTLLEQIDILPGLTRVGRTSAEVLLRDDPYVAPIHAWIFIGPQGVRLRDAGTANGVFLHETAPRWLEDGDAFVVGSQLLLFRDRWQELHVPPEGACPFGSAGWDSPFRVVNLRRGGDVAAVHPIVGELVIGRDGPPPYRQDRYLARRHLGFALCPEGVRLQDLSGGRGYFRRLRGEEWVAEGQPFLVGGKLLRLRFHG